MFSEKPMDSGQLHRRLKIVLISTLPPVPCGVADYTELLQSHLQARGHTVETITSNVWDIAKGFAIHRLLKMRGQGGVVHFQYPSLGFGAGLAPQVAALLSHALPTVVTLHEFSRVHLLRKMTILPFIFATDHLIFTSEYERKILSRVTPWIRNRSSVVGIGSNVPEPEGEIIRQQKTIGYFGTIRPDKGLEQYVELAEIMLKHDPTWNFLIMGVASNKTRAYMQGLMRLTAALPNIVWLIGMDMLSVSKRLASIRYVYLPFPDGASERRGSLLGALSCRTIVITTRGPHTTGDILGAVLIAESPAMALNEIVRLEKDSALRHTMQKKSRYYVQERSWSQIVAKHELIYQRIIR